MQNAMRELLWGFVATAIVAGVAALVGAHLRAFYGA
jgi:hypothetical protein